jgi:hypothetical protein
MIKWNCNFNIPNSSIQLDVAYITVTDYKVTDDYSIVSIMITDETKEIIVKEYIEKIQKIFNNIDEIYIDLLEQFSNSVIVS